VVIPGLLIGLVFAAVPGLQISMAIAIFLPMTLIASLSGAFFVNGLIADFAGLLIGKIGFNETEVLREL